METTCLLQYNCLHDIKQRKITKINFNRKILLFIIKPANLHFFDLQHFLCRIIFYKERFFQKTACKKIINNYYQ